MTTFFEMFKVAETGHKDAEQATRAAKDILRTAESNERKAAQNLVHLKLINDRVQRRSFETKEPVFATLEDCRLGYTTWKETFTKPGEVWSDRTDAHSYSMENTQYEFRVHVYESTKHKKFKYFVAVTAASVGVGESPWAPSTSSKSFNYGKDKYGEEITGDKKFSKREEAEAYACNWLERLTEDHKEVLDREDDLLRAAWEQIEHDRAALIDLGVLPYYLKPCACCGKGIEKEFNQSRICEDCEKLDPLTRHELRKAKEEGRA